MACKTLFSFLGFLLVFNLLLAIAGQAAAAAGRPTPNTSKNVDVKQPEWWIKSDHSFLIPGIGRVLEPPSFGFPHYDPYTGNQGGGGLLGGYLPGGDDTFAPNPGFEVPSPGSGSVDGCSPQAHP